MRKRRVEEFSLTNGCGIGNNNDHSGMQRFLSIEGQKIGTIIRYKRVVWARIVAMSSQSLQPPRPR